MAATYWTGKYGKVSLGGVSYAGQKFTVSIETTPVDVTNFNSPSGWREFRSGFSKGSVDIECVLDTSLAQVNSLGDTMNFVGTLGTGETITCSFVLSGYTYGQDINGFATLKIKGYLTGLPTIVFV